MPHYTTVTTRTTDCGDAAHTHRTPNAAASCREHRHRRDTLERRLLAYCPTPVAVCKCCTLPMDECLTLASLGMESFDHAMAHRYAMAAKCPGCAAPVASVSPHRCQCCGRWYDNALAVESRLDWLVSAYWTKATAQELAVEAVEQDDCPGLRALVEEVSLAAPYADELESWLTCTPE